VNFLIRPGFMYSSMGTSTPNYDSATNLMLSVSLEFEVYVTDDFSVSAAHGFALNSADSGAPNSSSATDYGTFGNNLTEFGFHYYLKKK